MEKKNPYPVDSPSWREWEKQAGRDPNMKSKVWTPPDKPDPWSNSRKD